MARTPSMSQADCEAALGARGHLQVTTDNRTIVRKWLTAQGFPALFCGGLSMRELALAYNRTDGEGLQALKRKLAEASANGFNDADDASENTDGQKANPKAATVEAGDFASSATSAASSPASFPRPATAASQGDLQGAMQALQSALAAIAGNQGVNESAVEAIAARVAEEKDAKLATKITDKVAEIADAVAKSAGIVRVEIQKGDDVRELPGTHHPSFPTLLKACAARQADGFHPNVWIAGPAGTGKTYAASKVAEAMGLQFEYNGALSMPHELLGFRDAGGTYHETAFRRAYTGPALYLFDEVDGSDNSALLALNAALANGKASFPDGQHSRHKDSVVIATANTWGLGATAEYVGRAKIDAAFLSRFPVRIFWDYDNATEARICGNEAFAARVQKAREKARAAGIKVLIDPRATIAGAGLIAGGFSEQEAADMTYLANLTPEQRQMIGG